jgi:hypothetical protein
MDPVTFCIRFALSILAVWRLCHLIAKEDGPFHIVARLRHRAGSGFAGQLLDCFYCLSLWIAAPFALWTASGTFEQIATWLALSGAACLLERAGERPAEVRRLDLRPERNESWLAVDKTA